MSPISVPSILSESRDRRTFSLKTRASFLVLTLLLSSAATRAELKAPEKLGPYPVGVTTIQMEDPARTDETLQGPRPLLAEIWYPAAPEAKDGTPTKFTDFYLGGENPQMNAILTLAFRFDIAAMDERFETIAVRDAAIASGTFPLLIFSHGNGGMRAQSTFWCDHMASHGYIVAAVDHTRNASATSYKGQVIPYDREGRGQAAIDRPKDVSFLIDQMVALNGDDASKFHQRIDTEQIGVAGHSFGGFTAMAAITQDPRIDAIAPMAAVVPDFSDASSRPLLLFVATEDDTIDAKGNQGARAYFDATKAPKFLVEMKDAGHYSFSDMFQINPAWGDGVGTGERITNGEKLTYLPMETVYRYTNGYSVAFFDKYLKEDDVHVDYLMENQDDSELIVRAVP